MSHLHTVNDPALIPLCLRAAQSGDSLLLIEDGVYNAQPNKLKEFPAGISVYALQTDLIARGLTDRMDATVNSASDADFVRLCCQHDKVINWF